MRGLVDSEIRRRFEGLCARRRSAQPGGDERGGGGRGDQPELVGGAGGPDVEQVARLSGGASKEQFSFTLRNSDGTSEKLVLRIDPRESIVETYRAREFEVIAAMKGVVPVPGVRWVDSDGSFFGNSALICDVVSGVAKPTTKHGDGGQVSGIGAGFPQRLTALFPIERRRQRGAQRARGRGGRRA